VPFRDQVSPSLRVQAPLGGYVIPAAWAADIAPRLTLHGIVFAPVRTASRAVRAQVFRASHAKFSAAPFEGRMRVQLDGSWQRESQDIGAGAVFVPIAQPGARLVMHLLEPQAPDSFAAWGLFNACFEQKERMEPYVAEQIAREMLTQDPSLQQQFEAQLAADAAFAASGTARLDFFLRRHASWDTRLNLYPVLRVDELLASP
jgi:hypothetical protein